MFNWVKNFKINRRVSQAKKYLETHFSDQNTEDIIQYSIKNNSDTASKPKYSMREGSSDAEIKYQSRGTSQPKYSLRDNYDSSTIQKAMRSMPTTPTARVLKELENNTNMTFVDKMLEHISKRHMRDSDVYKAAQIDRRLFSKIVSDREYKPAKDTCLAFAIALQLTLSEAQDLLSRAGYTLSHSSKRDVVIEYFFKEHIYDLSEINEVLFQLEQKVIGR